MKERNNNLYERKTFTDDLPMKIYKGTCSIDWIKVIAMKIKIKFIYDNIKDEIEIKEYDGVYLHIKYKDKDEFKIRPADFLKCKLGTYFGKYSKNGAPKFKVEIGQVIEDDIRDLKIIKREYRKKIIKRKNKKNCINNQKWYRYECNKCGHKHWIEETNLLIKKCGCEKCSYNKVQTGINDMATTDPWMVDFFQEKDKWMTKKYSHGCGKKIVPICPICGRKIKKCQ